MSQPSLSRRRFSVFTVLSVLALVIAAPAVEAQVPTFSKAFTPDTIGPGSTTALVFTISSSNPSSISDLAFTDNLPAGVTISSPANATSSCGGTLSAPDGSGTIDLSGGGLSPSGSCVISVDVTSSTAGTHTNTTGDLTSSAGNSGPATDDLIVATDRPGFTKSFAPGAVSLGGRSTLTFTIDNTANPTQMFNLTFTDVLPAGLEVASPANVTDTCASAPFTGGTVIAVPGTSIIALAYGTDYPAVDASGSCTVTVDVVAVGGGLLGNTTSELTAYPNPPTGLRSCGRASAVLDVTVDAVSLVKSFTDDPLPPGGTGTLDFSITNFSRFDPVTGIAFTDDLDATLTGLVAVPPLPTNPCGAGSTLSGTGLLTLSGGNLPAEGSCSFSVTVQAPTAAAAGAYPNTTSAITATVGGSPVVGSPGFDILFIEPAPVLTKEFSDDPVGPGGTVTIHFTITNTSPASSATNIAFIDELTTFMPFPVSVTLPAAGFCGAGATMALVSLGTDRQGISMTGGSLAAAGSCSFDVLLDIPVGFPCGTYTNTTEEITATVAAVTVTGSPASDNLVVVGAPRLNKEFTDDPVQPGGTVTLQFTLTHDDLAPGDATAITFSDNLDATLTGLAAIGLPINDVCGTGSQIAGTTNISLTGGTLAPGASCTFTATLQVPAVAAAGAHPNSTSSVVATVLGVPAIENAASDDLQIAGLVTSKEFTDDPVIPGDTVNLRFTLTNDHPTDGATNIIFTDNLNAVVSGLAATGLPLNDICGTGSQITGTTNLIFTGGSVAAGGGSCSFDITVVVPGAAADGIYNNTTSAVQATIGGSTLALDPATDTLTVSSNLLQLTKTFTDDPVPPGGTVTLELSLTNLDAAQTATGITFTDDLDAALTGLAAVGLPINDVCGAGSQIAGTSLLTLTGGNLAGGGSCTFNVTLQVPMGVTPGTLVTNTTSSVSGTIAGLPIYGDPASDDLQINFLSFSKAFDGPSVAGGTPVLSFTIENLDPAAGAAGLSFTDDLDAVITGLVATGLPLSDVCGAGSVLSGTSFLTLSNGSLLPGGSCTINVPLQVPAGATAGSYPNTSSDLFQAGLPAAAPATDTLQIEFPPTFSKGFAPASILYAGTSTLTFTIDNTASVLAASALDFTDNLPAGMVVATPANASTTCTGGSVTAVAGSGVISYTGGSIAAGASCTVQADVSAFTSGSLLNTSGDLTSSSGNSGPASATLTVADQPPGFSKAFLPNPMTAGGTSALSLTIDNTGSTGNTTALDFTDNLPAGVLIATPANAFTTCTGGVVTAVAGSGSVSYSGGTVAAGASCTVQVDVTCASPGTYVNTTGDLTSSLGNSGPATDTLIVNQPPVFGKAFAPATIVSGAVSTLSFTIDNSANPSDATAVDVTDNMPVEIVVATPSNASTTCTGGTLTAVSGTVTIAYTGGTVPAGTSCTISVDVTSSTPGAHLNTSGALTSSLGNSGTASDTLTVDPPPLFSKAFAPVLIIANGVSTLTLTIDNSAGALDATALDLTDVMPAALVIATPANASTTCTGGVLTATAGTSTIAYSGGTVTAGATCMVQADVTGSTLGDHLNTSGDLTSSHGNSGPASATLTITLAPPFSKQFAPGVIAANGVSTLTLTIDNSAGAIDATGLDLSDVMPAELVVANPANAATTCTGGTLTAVAGTSTISYTGGTVAAGATCTVQADVTSSTPGDHLNTSGDLTSSLGNSGPASDTLSVAGAPLFSKQFAPAAISPYGVSTLTLTIDNSAGAIDATGLDLSDVMPAALVIANPANAATTCTGGTLTAVAGTGTISYTGGTVAAGATCTVQADVTGTTPGDHLNTSGDLSSSLGNSGPASDTLTVSPALGFTKVFAPTTIEPGASSTVTFTIDNTAGVVDATGLGFVDNLPAGMLVADPANASTTCTGGTLTAPAGSASISYSGGSVAAGATCVITVDVSCDTAGDYVNTTEELSSSLGPGSPATGTLNVAQRRIPTQTPLGLLILAALLCLVAVHRLRGWTQ